MAPLTFIASCLSALKIIEMNLHEVKTCRSKGMSGCISMKQCMPCGSRFTSFYGLNAMYHALWLIISHFYLADYCIRADTYLQVLKAILCRKVTFSALALYFAPVSLFPRFKFSQAVLSDFLTKFPAPNYSFHRSVSHFHCWPCRHFFFTKWMLVLWWWAICLYFSIWNKKQW